MHTFDTHCIHIQAFKALAAESAQLTMLGRILEVSRARPHNADAKSKSRHKSSKVLAIFPLYGQCTRPLTFEFFSSQ